MKNIVYLIILLFVFSAGLFAQSKLEQNFNNMAEEILDNLQQFYPVKASEKGIHTHNYKLTDYSKGSIKDEISKLKKFEQRLYKYSKSGLSEENKINLKLLKSNVDIALQDLSKIKWHEKNPYIYIYDAIHGVYFILISEHAPLGDRVQNIIARMKAIPDLFRQARNNLKSPPPVYIELARDMIGTGKGFFQSVSAELSGKFPELASEITTSAERAIQSMNEFDTFLQNINPGSDDSFAIGKNDFDYKLEHEYFLDFNSDSLLTLGEVLLREADSVYNAYLAVLDKIDYDNDSVFVIDCIEKQDVLDYYSWEVEQVRQFLIRKEIVAVPDDIGQCIVVETPTFLHSVISSIAYQYPGTFNPDQTGHFYVRPISDTLDGGQKDAFYRYIHRRGFRGSVVHEAYPGHHYQLQMAALNRSDIRKWQENRCLIEGWALYCEEMMYENKLYGSDPRAYLRILNGIRYRAARIILDVKLHTGRISRGEAAVWLSDKFEKSLSQTEIEINHYTLTPTYPMCYLIGKLKLLELRDDVRKKEGDAFSIRAFHDRLLAEGSIPIPLIREEWGL